MSKYWHQWNGTDEEFNQLVLDLGKDRVRPVASIDWKSTKIQVMDAHKGHWVVVRVGDYIMEQDGQVWVTSGR